jgi:hypothetical protein
MCLVVSRPRAGCPGSGSDLRGHPLAMSEAPRGPAWKRCQGVAPTGTRSTAKDVLSPGDSTGMFWIGAGWAAAGPRS